MRVDENVRGEELPRLTNPNLLVPCSEGARRRAMAATTKAAASAAAAAAAPLVSEYVAVIGLEVHAQLQHPRTKLFSRAPGAGSTGGSATSNSHPNSHVAAFDAALPG